VVSVGAAAARVLGELGDKRAVLPLINTLKSRWWHIRNLAAESLKRLTGQDFGTDYDEWLKWWRNHQK